MGNVEARRESTKTRKVADEALQDKNQMWQQNLEMQQKTDQAYTTLQD